MIDNNTHIEQYLSDRFGYDIELRNNILLIWLNEDNCNIDKYKDGTCIKNILSSYFLIEIGIIEYYISNRTSKFPWYVIDFRNKGDIIYIDFTDREHIIYRWC